MSFKGNKEKPLSELVEEYKKREKKRKKLKMVLVPSLILFVLLFSLFGPLKFSVLFEVGQNILGIKREEYEIEEQEVVGDKKLEKEIEPENLSDNLLGEENLLKDDSSKEKGRTINNKPGSSDIPPLTDFGSYSSDKTLTQDIVTPEIEKCSTSTKKEYERLVRINKEMFKYHDDLRNSNLSRDLAKCKDDYDYCLVQMNRTLIDFDRTHNTGSAGGYSGRLAYEREQLEWSLKRQCENSYSDCNNNANTKFQSDSKTLEYDKQVKYYEDLLSSCF